MFGLLKSAAVTQIEWEPILLGLVAAKREPVTGKQICKELLGEPHAHSVFVIYGKLPELADLRYLIEFHPHEDVPYGPVNKAYAGDLAQMRYRLTAAGAEQLALRAASVGLKMPELPVLPYFGFAA